MTADECKALTGVLADLREVQRFLAADGDSPDANTFEPAFEALARASRTIARLTARYDEGKPHGDIVE